LKAKPKPVSLPFFAAQPLSGSWFVPP